MARKKILPPEPNIDVSDVEAIVTSKSKKPKIPKQVKASEIKVQSMPETYVEDTFDFDKPITPEKVIENKTKVKHKHFVTRDELINSAQFKIKFKKLTARVEFEKSFDFLLDYVEATKLLKSVYIDDDIDEYDIILEEIVLYFKKRLKRINLSYDIYSLVDDYFNSLKTLYGRFKRMELSENDELVSELERIKSMTDFIKYYIF